MTSSREISDLQSKLEVVLVKQNDFCERLDEIKSLTEGLDGLLRGSNEQPIGFITRLDRLEQSEQKRAWQLRALWTGLVAVLGELGIRWGM